jgi:hypothetical protein
MARSLSTQPIRMTFKRVVTIILESQSERQPSLFQTERPKIFKRVGKTNSKPIETFI